MEKRKFKGLSGLVLIVMFVMFFANTPMQVSAMSNEDLSLYKTVFDANYYYSAYPEVAASCGPNYMALLTHFITKGAAEGKSGCAEFCPAYYKAKYSDLSKAFGNDTVSYIRHYLTRGMKEGRVGNSKEAADVIPANIAIAATNPVQISTYTTKYNDKIQRATNVQLASLSMNGTIVMPGEEFSYTNTVGPRTKQRGYVEAPVYSGGEVSTGIGGGICQVSSTLYAAMKTCGIPATERHAHSLPVHYVPEGWDATVSGTTIDLKFKNIYNYPIYIESEANSGLLTVNLYFLK